MWTLNSACSEGKVFFTSLKFTIYGGFTRISAEFQKEQCQKAEYEFKG